MFSYSAFNRILKVPLRPYDFNQAPNNTWIDEKGKPTDNAREATAFVFNEIAKKLKLDPLIDFERIVHKIKARTFAETENYWGTKFDTMLHYAYGSSPKAAILDYKRSLFTQFKPAC